MSDMTASNRISKVAVVGAGGNVGRFMTEALLGTGKHTVTAITREDSQSKLPEGVAVAKVGYDKHDTLVKALKGHDALIITLSGHSAIQEIEEKIARAAVEAGVPWILPNEWSPDTANEELVKDVFVFQPSVALRKTLETLNKSSYIAVITGFWYEYCMAVPGAFGFDLGKRTLTFFDEGETKISVSTWPQVGRAVAALLSLPVRPEGSDNDVCLENYRNRVVYINSFTVNQKDMLASALRVTHTKEKDWTITTESTQERYASGLAEIKEGKRSGFLKVMFTRVFYPDGNGDFEHGRGTLNGVLGLPKEDMDEATTVAVERSKHSPW